MNEFNLSFMSTNLSTSMLKQTLAPVVLMAVLWVSMSSATTFYVQWLERSHQRIFLENIVSIRAAEAMQILVWKLAAEWPDDEIGLSDFRQRWKEIEPQINDQHQKLVQSAFSDSERAVLSKLDTSLASLLQCFHRAFGPVADNDTNLSKPANLEDMHKNILEIAGRIAASTNELLKMNQELADQGSQQRQRISRIVISARMSMLVIGPLLGVILGWRLSRLLHHSIARISVTLHDANSNSESDFGSIAVETSDDFQEVQQQAEKVAERMRQVSRDLQTARHEVLRSERLAAVGELAAGVAHEIRNPLTSVKLLLQHAVRQANGPKLDESQIGLILEEIGRMETTIQGLLDFSRPPRLNRIPHDFRQTLQRALNLVESRARQQRIEIITHVGDAPLMVNGDTEMLHQVLVNLLINAIEAMNLGGRITIEATASMLRLPKQGSDSSNGTATDQPVVQMIIRDTGQGIPDEVLPRLFEPFATSKERGTGLGLAVSHRIIEEHHGSIVACNCPEGGAQFTLTIPAVDRNDMKS
jgi:signal transduction histidine kinase